MHMIREDDMMQSFVAVFNNLINNFRSIEIATSTIMAVVLVVTMLSIYEFIVYRFVLHRALYNKAFNICISVIPFFISTIILCLQTNLVITLGTIGALAIIRFRTAVKDPVDMIFILWSIHIGITCGCQLYEISIITSIVVTLVLIALNHVSFGTKSHVLVIHTDSLLNQEEIEEVVKRYSKKYRVKCRNYTGEGTNFVYELNTNEATTLSEQISKIDTVNRFSLMEYEPDDIL